MLTIRLSRIGTKNKPMYRLVIAENARDLYGKALEILGSYNPHTKKLDAKNERIKYWLGNGAQMSPSVNNLLLEKKIIEGKKVKASKAGKKKEEKPAETAPKVESEKAEPAETPTDKTETPVAEATETKETQTT